MAVGKAWYPQEKPGAPLSEKKEDVVNHICGFQQIMAKREPTGWAGLQKTELEQRSKIRREGRLWSAYKRI